MHTGGARGVHGRCSGGAGEVNGGGAGGARGVKGCARPTQWVREGLWGEAGSGRRGHHLFECEALVEEQRVRSPLAPAQVHAGEQVVRLGVQRLELAHHVLAVHEERSLLVRATHEVVLAHLPRSR